MPEISSAKLSIRPELLPCGEQARVLDVGCGDGRHIAAAATRGCRAVGVDYDPNELRKARTRLGGHHVGVDLVVADATRLPFRDAAFDAAICTETLEHLPDDRGAIAEVARVLRDSALLHGAVPSHFTELVYWRLSRGYYRTPGGHVRIYAPKVLTRRLAERGLRVRDVRYIHFVDSLVWLRFCLADAFLPKRQPRSDFEAAVLIAEAQMRPVAGWRRRLRRALATSRFIAALDTAGALVWPKSFAFVAEKRPGRGAPGRGGARDGTAAGSR
ncbi:MAG TPA: class I SAM-dependent methyltransferase [Dehalococcoidia bacterium]|nr:class I SAM-dependent methyltransferase [Dehalococcoidia bacterium]